MQFSFTMILWPFSLSILVDLLGPLAWYIPTTICGTLVVAAGFLTLFVSDVCK